MSLTACFLSLSCSPFSRIELIRENIVFISGQIDGTAHSHAARLSTFRLVKIRLQFSDAGDPKYARFRGARRERESGRR